MRLLLLFNLRLVNCCSWFSLGAIDDAAFCDRFVRSREETGTATVVMVVVVGNLARLVVEFVEEGVEDRVKLEGAKSAYSMAAWERWALCAKSNSLSHNDVFLLPGRTMFIDGITFCGAFSADVGLGTFVDVVAVGVFDRRIESM
jgi:hypothetical protein